jgi:type II secretory pathway component PulJ
MKNSFTVLEIILSVLISSLVIINSAHFSKELFQTNKDMQNIEILKLDLLSTKIFLQKYNLNLKKNLRYEDNTLYFKENILLQEVSSFSILRKPSYFQISIEVKNRIKEKWNINI